MGNKGIHILYLPHTCSCDGSPFNDDFIDQTSKYVFKYSTIIVLFKNIFWYHRI